MEPAGKRFVHLTMKITALNRPFKDNLKYTSVEMIWGVFGNNILAITAWQFLYYLDSLHLQVMCIEMKENNDTNQSCKIINSTMINQPWRQTNEHMIKCNDGNHSCRQTNEHMI